MRSYLWNHCRADRGMCGHSDVICIHSGTCSVSSSDDSPLRDVLLTPHFMAEGTEAREAQVSIKEAIFPRLGHQSRLPRGSGAAVGHCRMSRSLWGRMEMVAGLLGMPPI